MLVLPPWVGLTRAAILKGRSGRRVEPLVAAAKPVRPDPDAGQVLGFAQGQIRVRGLLGSRVGLFQ